MRNPTNLGWVLAIIAAGARAGPARAARRPVWQLHHQLERLVASGRSSAARAAAHGLAPVAPVLSPLVLFALGGDAKTVHRTAGAGAGWRIGPIAAAIRTASRPWHEACADPPRIRRRHGRRCPRARGRPRFSLSHAAGRTRQAALPRSIMSATGMRRRRPCTGVEVRDPTADLDVVSYCFGVPPEQYLAEGIDRSLIRRAMWGLLPEIVLDQPAHSGLQAADWYEKLEGRREELAGRNCPACDLAARAQGDRSRAPRAGVTRLARRLLDTGSR